MKLELLFYSVLVLDSLPFRFPLVNLFLTHFSAVNTNCKHLSITGDIESRIAADKNSHFVLHRLPFFFGSAAVVCPCHCVNRTACKYAMDNVEIAICLSGALRGCMTLSKDFRKISLHCLLTDETLYPKWSGTNKGTNEFRI